MDEAIWCTKFGIKITSLIWQYCFLFFPNAFSVMYQVVLLEIKRLKKLLQKQVLLF